MTWKKESYRHSLSSHGIKTHHKKNRAQGVPGLKEWTPMTLNQALKIAKQYADKGNVEISLTLNKIGDQYVLISNDIGRRESTAMARNRKSNTNIIIHNHPQFELPSPKDVYNLLQHSDDVSWVVTPTVVYEMKNSRKPQFYQSVTFHKFDKMIYTRAAELMPNSEFKAVEKDPKKYEVATRKHVLKAFRELPFTMNAYQWSNDGKKLEFLKRMV